MPTPIRDKKVGLPDPQANGGQPTVATTEPSAMVQQMAAQNFALKNGGQMPPVMQGAPNSSIPPVATVQPMNVFAGGNQIIGKYNVPVNPNAQPQQNPASAPTTDFTNIPSTPQFTPQGAGNANPQMGPVATPYMKDAAEATPQNVTNFEQMPASQQATGWNPDGTAKYDSLSAALNGTAQQPQQAQFQADPSQRDGGFFNWVKGLIPKKRPGRREGETDDEYDARHTRNMQMVATLADAIRHMGNIVNTSKGAPLQQFNDPNTMLEQGRQARKAERQKQAALDADAAYKQADLTLKERAAATQKAYKEYLQSMKGRAADLADNKFEYQKDKDKQQFNYKVGQDEIANQIKMWDMELKEKGFNEKERHNRISEAISNFRAHKSGSSGGRGRGGGSTPKYVTWDADGNPHYAYNQTMYEANEAYYNGNTSGKSSTSNSKEVINKDGSTSRVTNRQGGSSVAQKAGAQRRQREEARKAAKGKGKKGGWASGFKL